MSFLLQLPEMIRNRRNKLRTFLLNNIGMYIGFTVMLLLAIFEEKIAV